MNFTANQTYKNLQESKNVHDAYFKVKKSLKTNGDQLKNSEDFYKFIETIDAKILDEIIYKTLILRNEIPIGSLMCYKILKYFTNINTISYKNTLQKIFMGFAMTVRSRNWVIYQNLTYDILSKLNSLSSKKEIFHLMHNIKIYQGICQLGYKDLKISISEIYTTFKTYFTLEMCENFNTRSEVKLIIDCFNHLELMQQVSKIKPDFFVLNAAKFYQVILKHINIFSIHHIKKFYYLLDFNRIFLIISANDPAIIKKYKVILQCQFLTLIYFILVKKCYRGKLFPDYIWLTCYIDFEEASNIILENNKIEVLILFHGIFSKLHFLESKFEAGIIENNQYLHSECSNVLSFFFSIEIQEISDNSINIYSRIFKKAVKMLYHLIKDSFLNVANLNYNTILLNMRNIKFIHAFKSLYFLIDIFKRVKGARGVNFSTEYVMDILTINVYVMIIRLSKEANRIEQETASRHFRYFLAFLIKRSVHMREEFRDISLKYFRLIIESFIKITMSKNNLFHSKTVRYMIYLFIIMAENILKFDREISSDLVFKIFHFQYLLSTCYRGFFSLYSPDSAMMRTLVIFFANCCQNKICLEYFKANDSIFKHISNVYKRVDRYYRTFTGTNYYI